MNHMETNHASLLSLEPGQLAMLGTETLFPDLDVSASCPSAMFDPDILMVMRQTSVTFFRAATGLVLRLDRCHCNSLIPLR